jgi:hypothetical protein
MSMIDALSPTTFFLLFYAIYDDFSDIIGLELGDPSNCD